MHSSATARCGSDGETSSQLTATLVERSRCPPALGMERRPGFYIQLKLWVATIDADTLLMPYSLRRAVARMLASPPDTRRRTGVAQYHFRHAPSPIGPEPPLSAC